LTARLELRPIRPLDPFSIAGSRSRATANLRCHFAAALSTACDAGERPLTLSVALRARPGRDQTPPGAPRTDSPASSSKGAAFSAQSAFHRQVLPWVCFRRARFGGSPPPVSRLCHRGPGFRRAFATPSSRPEWLDPASHSSALHRGGVAGQTSPVDFCNQSRSASTTAGPSEPRAPRSWSPTSAAVFRTAPFRQRDGLRVAVRERTPTKTSRARGRLEGVRPRCTAPPAAIARGGSFTPTRSARTPHVARS
jgi:hypothetical protein